MMTSHYLAGKLVFTFFLLIATCSLWGQEVILDLKNGLKDNSNFYSNVIKKRTITEEAVLRLKNSRKSNKELKQKYEGIRLAYDEVINSIQADFKTNWTFSFIRDLWEGGEKKKEYALKIEFAEKKRKIFLKSAYLVIDDGMALIDIIDDPLNEVLFPELHVIELANDQKEISKVMVNKLELCRYKKWDDIH